MTTKKFIFILTLFSTVTSAQTITGRLEDYEQGHGIDFAQVVLRVGDSTKAFTRTDDKGNFELKNIPSGMYNLVILATGYDVKKIDSISIPKNSKLGVIELPSPTGGISCGPEIRYICEEDNPAFDVIVDGKAMQNYTDKSGLKQGLWYKVYDRHKDPKSDYTPNALVWRGYYKDNKKIGRWIYVNSKGRVKKVVTYKMDKVVRVQKCTPENFLQKPTK